MGNFQSLALGTKQPVFRCLCGPGGAGRTKGNSVCRSCTCLLAILWLAGRAVRGAWIPGQSSASAPGRLRTRGGAIALGVQTQKWMGIMGQAQQLKRTAVVVEDDAEQRWPTALLLQESGLETIECDSAEAALATMLMRGREVCMVFADLHLSGVMDGIDLARELKMRWPHLALVVTSGNPGTRLVHLPPGAVYMPKPWQTLSLLREAERALSTRSVQGRYGR